MGTDVWSDIDRELTSTGRTWAWLGRKIEVSDQVLHNWRSRGVPSKRYAAIAAALGLAWLMAKGFHWL